MLQWHANGSVGFGTRGNRYGMRPISVKVKNICRGETLRGSWHGPTSHVPQSQLFRTQRDINLTIYRFEINSNKYLNRTSCIAFLARLSYLHNNCRRHVLDTPRSFYCH